MEALLILLAFFAGLVFKAMGYPALPGYLLAGFFAHGMAIGDVELITAIADVGLLLLLFTIGLKLDPRDIVTPQIWGVASLQIAIAVPLTTIVILLSGFVFPVMALQDSASAWTLAFALSFSSTVFAVKIYDERGETASYHARLAIGVLVLQDILAVSFLVVSSGKLPSVFALALPLLFFLRPVLLWLVRQSRHTELVLLLGIALALSGAELFEALSLKGGLGALMFGLLLSGTPYSKELYNSMISLKDLFLIGFFLQIGYYGLPTQHMWFVALALSLLIFLRPLIYFVLFVAFRLRARTALLAGAGLFNYSEFGLIVAAYAVSDGILPPEWLTTIALAVTISFFIATPFNTRIHRIYSRFSGTLHRLEREKRLAAELPADLGDSQVVVLGLGRVGIGVYERLSMDYPGRIVGVEENPGKVEAHLDAGINCVRGDANDYDFWAHSGLLDKDLVVICLTNHSENIEVIKLAQAVGFQGDMAVISRYPDEREELEQMGCISFNLYGEAGHGFAEHLMSRRQLESA